MHQEFFELLDLLLHVRQPMANDQKAVCHVARVSSALGQQLKSVVGIDTTNFTLTVDSFGLSHALGGHSQERGSRDHYPLLEADILALPTWLTAPDVVIAGQLRYSSQPLRVIVERLELFTHLKTVVVLELRPRWRRLVLVTMYKTKTG